MLNKRNKYGNTKIESDGVKFDSKLEKYCYDKLKLADIDFEFQVRYTLIPKFRFREDNIRAMEMRVDFLLHHNGMDIWLDTKGMATQDAKNKYKFLRYLEKDKENVDVIWVKNQKEVNNLVNQLIINI